MSFKFDITVGTKAEAIEKIGGDPNLPASIAAFITAAMSETDFTDKDVAISAEGHLHVADDYPTSSAIVTVKAVERVQTPQQSAEGEARPLPETVKTDEVVLPVEDAAAKAGA